MTNEALREHVTSTGFALTLGKTHIAELVRMDLELAAEVMVDGRQLGKLHRCDMTARHALGARGLIVHVWEENKDQYQRPETDWAGRPTGRMVRDHDKYAPPGKIWNITRAGRLVIELLQESGLYSEYAGPLLPLIENARDKRKGAAA